MQNPIICNKSKLHRGLALLLREEQEYLDLTPELTCGLWPYIILCILLVGRSLVGYLTQSIDTSDATSFNLAKAIKKQNQRH